MRHRTRSRLSGCAVVATLVAAPAALAQPAEQEGGFTPILVFESVAPLEALSHPLDAGLRRAMSMLPARLAELPDEIPGYAGPDGQTLALIARTLLTSSPRVAVVDYGPDPQTGAPGFAALVELRMQDEAQAQQLHEAIVGALALAPAAPPIRQADDGSGALVMDLPTGSLRFGPMRDADGAWRYRAAMGALQDEAALFALLLTPPNDASATLMRGELNLEPVLAPAMAMAQMAAGDAGVQALAPYMDMLAAKYQLLAYQQRNRTIMDIRMANVREALLAMGYSQTPLTANDFRAVPQDATIAAVFRYSIAKWWVSMRSFLDLAPDFEEGLAQFEAETGVNVEADLIDPLGDVGAFYLSDATGGGGVLSAVAAVQLRDAPRLERALAQLADRANQRLANIPPGDGERSYYHIARTVANDGTAYFGLRFPGLPVPIEPTAAIAGDWLVVGATPQAAITAIAQAQGKRAGDLGARQRLFEGGRSQLVQYQFVNGPRALRDGYTLMSLVSSALANGVRSPSDGQREPGIVLPPLLALLEGSRGDITQKVWWEGDTLISRTESFAPVVASTTATVGAMAKVVGGVWGAIGAGVLLPALDRARQQATVLHESAQLKQLHLGMTIYANTNNNRYPDDVQTLIDQALIPRDVLASPLDWAGDGEGDFFLRMGGEMTFEDDRMMGYSRAGYATSDLVNVVFDDNHVEAVALERFHTLLQHPKNRGVDWRLPRRVRQFEPDFMRKPKTPMKRAG